MDLVYRKAGEGDLDYPLECHCRICHVCNNFRPGGRPDYASFRARFVERGVWEESRTHMVASLKDDRTLLSIVETESGRRVGYIWVVFRDWFEQHTADINDVYVEEEFRRQGVAMRMLSYVEAEARKRGANLLVSGTGVDNEVSQRLHRKYGFGIRRYEYQIWLDDSKASRLMDTLDPIRFRQAVEAFAGGTVRAFHVVDVGRKTSTSGICGEYALPRVGYVTDTGATGEATFFVRRELKAQRGFKQEHHYRRLSALGLPTPRLYGAWLDGQGKEVLVLEPVAVVEADHDGWLADEGNGRALLSLLARFASLRVPTDYIALIGRDMAYRGDYTRSWNTWLPWSVYILGRVWEHALGNELGRELNAWCAENQGALPRLQESARAMLNRTGHIPQGMIHGDCHPGNVGWRMTGGRDLVLYDFEDVMIDFLLYDVALFLGSPDGMNPMKGTPVAELAEYYLKELKAYGGNAPPLPDFLRDVRLIWHTRKLNLWEHLPKELGGPGYHGPEGKDTREERQDRLLRLLQALVGQLPLIHQADGG